MPFFATYKAKMLADGEAAGQPPRLAASIEVAPAQVIKRPELLELIPPATRVALVDLGNLDVGAWAALTGRMARLGLEPVPHIAARRLASVDALDERLRAMTTEAGVRDVLVVAGEADRPAGHLVRRSTFSRADFSTSTASAVSRSPAIPTAAR
jgi:hypothetical protein